MTMSRGWPRESANTVAQKPAGRGIPPLSAAHAADDCVDAWVLLAAVLSLLPVLSDLAHATSATASALHFLNIFALRHEQDLPAQRRLCTRRPLTGPRSTRSARTRPTTGQNVQCPPNQLWTTEYQSRVVGRNTNPIIGHSRLSKTPRNQWVKNQSTATTSRGAARARSVMMHGIDQISSRLLRIEG